MSVKGWLNQKIVDPMLQILKNLMVPFLRLGETLTGGEPFELTSDALNKVITGQASSELLFSIARALLGWFVAAPIILGTLYLVFLPVFKYLVPKFSSAPDKKEHDS
ncbi:hypothetical protein GQ457_10G015610 [Hibiscus cannabinus]